MDAPKPTSILSQQESYKRALVWRGYCAPCARSIAVAGFTGTPRICFDCERLSDG